MVTPSKFRMPIAVKGSSRQDISSTHVTTTDFMQFNISNLFYPVPKEPYDLRQETFTRLEPLAVPTFGNANIFNRAYFVPFRTVWPAWNDFINDDPHVYDEGRVSIPQTIPYTTEGEVCNMFMLPAFAESWVNSTDNPRPDFVVTFYDSSGDFESESSYKLTPLGRRMWKLFRTLGFSMYMNPRSIETQSMLELLSVARVYIDFYYPAQYANDEDSNFILQLLTYNKGPLDNSVFNAMNLSRICRIIDNVVYRNDIFTAAWDNPNSPNNGLASAVTIRDVNDDESLETSKVVFEEMPYNKAPNIVGENETALSRISQYVINALRKLSDYFKRNQMAGSRVIDRYLARFGVTLSSEKLNRSYKIFEKVDNLHFGDVTATADTEGTPLGSYAGKGVGFNDGSFEFYTEEFGVILCVSTIVPVTSYYQGVSRHIKHLTRFDFWTPEFDGLGVQAIASQEVYSPVNTEDVKSDYGSKVFGFAPRYYEYKVGRDLITGDYILPSMNTGKDSWTLFRDMKPYVDSINGADNLVHSFDFVNGSDAEQYNRIFNYSGNGADHFNVIHRFTVKKRFPGRSLWDTYEFEDENESQKVTMEVGGRTEN